MMELEEGEVVKVLVLLLVEDRLGLVGLMVPVGSAVVLVVVVLVEGQMERLLKVEGVVADGCNAKGSSCEDGESDGWNPARGGVEGSGRVRRSGW